jgi:hypothetical protein
MNLDALQTISGYIALAVPITVAISNLAKLCLEWLKQNHEIKTSRIEQSHKITTQYLDRALDPSVPLAIRHQLLRFLATPDNSGDRLQCWAEREMKRVGPIVEATDQALQDAEKAILAAKSPDEVNAAERKLKIAMKGQQRLLEAPAEVEPSAAAFRAGLVKRRNLIGLNMTGQNLKGADFFYRKLRGANFSNSDMTRARFGSSDLRGANFQSGNLDRATFEAADLREASFRDAKLIEVNFLSARLEGVDFSGATFKDCDFRATYDESTIFPKDFNPVEAGGVLVAKRERSAPKENER